MRLLVTGATGTFGFALIEHILSHPTYECDIVALSRNESIQARRREQTGNNPMVKWVLGDVRDKERMEDVLLFYGVTHIVHAAALKRVDNSDPRELYATNIAGTMNVIRAAKHNNVEKVLVLSTDKACAPVTAYGVSKLAAEFYAVDSNKFSGCAVSCSRWGNVLGSAGSVVYTWARQARAGEKLTITAPEATRFWMTADDAVYWALQFLSVMRGGEIFVPYLKSAAISSVASAITNYISGGDPKYKITGLRSGEKLHESLISPDEGERIRGYMGTSYHVIDPPDQFPGYSPREGGSKWLLREGVRSNDLSISMNLNRGELIDMLKKSGVL